MEFVSHTCLLNAPKVAEGRFFVVCNSYKIYAYAHTRSFGVQMYVVLRNAQSENKKKCVTRCIFLTLLHFFTLINNKMGSLASANFRFSP